MIDQSLALLRARTFRGQSDKPKICLKGPISCDCTSWRQTSEYLNIWSIYVKNLPFLLCNKLITWQSWATKVVLSGTKNVHNITHVHITHFIATKHTQGTFTWLRIIKIQIKYHYNEESKVRYFSARCKSSAWQIF